MKRSNLKKPFLPFTLVLILCTGLIFSACNPKTTETEPTATQTAVQTEVPILTPTPRPSPTPTLPPLGMEGNPVTIGYILSEEDIESINAAEDIAFLISKDTGYAIESLIFPDFAHLAEAILAGEVHLFWPKTVGISLSQRTGRFECPADDQPPGRLRLWRTVYDQQSPRIYCLF